MKVIDPHRLVPDAVILVQVVETHPLRPRLSDIISTVEVYLSERHGIPAEQIETDLPNKRVRLGLGATSHEKSNFQYILYHEFSHTADRANPEFGYSDDRVLALTDSEQIAVMELWNLFIDSRLNVSVRPSP